MAFARLSRGAIASKSCNLVDPSSSQRSGVNIRMSTSCCSKWLGLKMGAGRFLEFFGGYMAPPSDSRWEAASSTKRYSKTSSGMMSSSFSIVFLHCFGLCRHGLGLPNRFQAIVFACFCGDSTGSEWAACRTAET